MRSRQKALFVADLAMAKKAESIVILDMRKLSNITGFFVIATASSTTRAQTIANNIEQGLLDKGESLSNIEGYQEARWVLVDAYDVTAHIFIDEVRRFYNLEGLWGDAPRIRLCQRKKKRKRRSKKPSKRK